MGRYYSRKSDRNREEIRAARRAAMDDVHLAHVRKEIMEACDARLNDLERHHHGPRPGRKFVRVEQEPITSSLRMLLLKATINEAKADGLIRRGGWYTGDEDIIDEDE